MNHKKIAIIGAGPAGISCAVQLKRFGIEAFLFEKNQIGGLLRNANLVENYLGFENGISGHALVEKFKKNLGNLDIEPIFEEVKKVSFSEGQFCIEIDDDLFTSEILVVASGTKPKKLCTSCHPELFCHPEQSEGSVQRYADSLGCRPQNDNVKIFYEIADLPEKNYSDKKFAIIGAGDTAFDYAINLVNNYHASEVVILNRSSKAKCLPLLEKRALETGKIKHIKNVNVDMISQTVIPNLFRNLSNNELILESQNGQTLKQVQGDKGLDCIIIAIGRNPCLDFLDESLIPSPSNLEQEGLLYFIGDVTNNNYRQTLIAAGEGIKAAMQIYDNNY